MAAQYYVIGRQKYLSIQQHSCDDVLDGAAPCLQHLATHLVLLRLQTLLVCTANTCMYTKEKESQRDDAVIRGKVKMK